MKPVKIYANKPFKGIRFESGFNVILGEPREKRDNKKDTHNLGKTLLIHVIDFLLLKKTTKTQLFVKQRQVFKGYVFYLELELNSGSFLVIRRGVDAPTKISFKLSTSRLNGFEQDLQWDHENVPHKKAIEILNKHLGFDVAPEWTYRKSISYFLRTQQDFLDVFQLAKYNKGPHREWKPFLFDMLGFEGRSLTEKYQLDDDKKELEGLMVQLREKFSIEAGDSDKIKGIIDLKTEEKKDVEKKIDDFNFYLQDKKINQELVDEVDSKISTLNTLRYSVTEEIKKIQASLRTDVPRIDMEELKDLYREVEIFFPDNLVREYKDLEIFNQQVSEERKKYMAERLEELNAELEPIEKELLQLDGKKSEMLSVLKDKDSYGKFKHYQKDLAKLEAEIARMEEKLTHLDTVGELETRVAELSEKIKEQAKVIRELIDRSNDVYREIRRHFDRIIMAVLNAHAIISLSQNKEGNIDFHADIQDPENMEVTAEGYGTTYKKFLCMAFDLAVLITYGKRSFYRFVYHDGALEGLDDRKKVNFLKAVRGICMENSLQYILTVIDSDIPHDEAGRPLTFPDDEVILKLHDRDDTGRLFEMSF